MNKTFLSLSLTLLALLSFSCGEKDIPEVKNFEGIYYDERTSDREYFDKVANEVLNHIRPSDQQAAISALNAFANYCETYTFPDNFYDDNYVAGDSRAVADALEQFDLSSLSRAVSNMVYSLSRFKGLYQAAPNGSEWQFIEKRDDVAFKYWIGQQEYNIVLSGAGSTWRESYTHDGVTYTVDIPQVLDFSLFKGIAAVDNTLITAKITTDGKESDHLTMNVSMRFGNLQLDTDTKVQPSKLNEDLILYVHNVSTYYRTVLVSSQLEILGSNLCSISAWDRATASASALKPMFSSATATTMLYKSIQIASKISSMGSFIDNIGGWWDTETSTNPKGDAEKAAQTLAKAVTSEVRYCSDNSGKVRATLGWEAYQQSSWGTYEDWGVRPTISFVSDGSTFDFESYFASGRFISIENTIRNYIKSYKSYWK